LSRQPASGRGYTHHQASHSSPPASAYFSRFNGDAEATPSKDANAQFAYSTTLRRHGPEGSFAYASGSGSTLESIGHIVSAESAGIWDRVRRFITGSEHAPLPMHDAELSIERGPKALHETLSSVYARYTIEVCVVPNNRARISNDALFIHRKLSRDSAQL
jgi:Ca2+-transporting ATPase